MTLFDFPPWIMLAWLFVLGTVLGSFLNVCIHRIPQHDSLWDQLRGLGYPPSRCPGCGASILRRDNQLILGILLLSAVLVIVGNLLTDLAYRLVDPRIKTGG